MITWGANDTYQYENGSQDAWITAQAQRMAAFGHPIFLRFYHEPDGDYRKNQVHTAADYIAAGLHNLRIGAGKRAKLKPAIVAPRSAIEADDEGTGC